MASKRSKRMLINFGVLLAPVAALKLAGLWFSPTPAAAHVDAGATTAATPAVPVKVSSIALSPEALERRSAAATYARSARALGFASTPFYYESQVQTTTPTQPDDPVVTPTLPGVPSFTVQVIMASDTETKALIDGKVYRVGDEYKDGWIVADIDGATRTVTIADPATNRTSTQAVRMPGERK